MRSVERRPHAGPGSGALSAASAAGSLEAFASASGNQALARRLDVRPINRRNTALVPRFLRKLNGVARGVRYDVDGGRLTAAPSGGAMSDFDRRMVEWIRAGRPVVPLRLTTRHGRELLSTGEKRVDVDLVDTGAVDMDDLDASDDDSFKDHLIHFIAERHAITGYARRIGTYEGEVGEAAGPEWRRAHGAGHAAELDWLRRELEDRELEGPRQSESGGSVVKTFTSPRGYEVGVRSTDDAEHVMSSAFTITTGRGRVFSSIAAWMASPERAAAMRQRPAGARP